MIPARESRQKGWWQQYGEAVPDWFEVFVGLEAEAATIWGYDAEFVPGILQTEEYARAVHRAQLITATEDEIDRLVRVRMARQELLTSDDAPQVWLILNEAVIRRVVGSPQIMREQLSRLIDASKLPNVTLQVVPFAGGAHPAMDGSFTLLGFPEPSDPNTVGLYGIMTPWPMTTRGYTLAGSGPTAGRSSPSTRHFGAPGRATATTTTTRSPRWAGR